MKSYFCCTTRPIIVKMLVYFEWWQIECWLKRVVRYPLKYRTTWTCLPAIMFGSGYDCLLLYSSDILWFVKQLWRQLLRSRERSCSSCKRKPPSGGGIGWEEFWQRSVESTCEKMSNAAGLPLGQTAAVSGYRCQNCEKRCWHIWLLRLRRRELFDCKLYGRYV